MLTSLTLFLSVAGLGLLAEFTWTGIACLAAAYWLHGAAVRDEDSFVGLVMILAGLYTVITAGQALWDAIGH